MNTEQLPNINLARLVRESTDEDGILTMTIQALAKLAGCRELMVQKYLRGQGFKVNNRKKTEEWEIRTTQDVQLRLAFGRQGETLVKHKPGRGKKIF